MISTDYYNKHADELADFYDGLDRSKVIPHDWYLLGSDVLDFGCGSGADARFMLNRGAKVLCYEPSDLVYNFINTLYQNKASWGPDRLSVFTQYRLFAEHVKVYREQFDYVLCSAVFQHLTMSQQIAAINLFKIALKPGCQAVISWRVDPYPPGDERVHYKIDTWWLTQFIRRHGFTIKLNHYTEDDRGVGFQSLTIVKK